MTHLHFPRHEIDLVFFLDTSTCCHRHVNRSARLIDIYSWVLCTDFLRVNKLLTISIANIATVFPGSKGAEMTLSLGRTTDRAFNPATAQVEPRTLVYAAVLVLDSQLKDEDGQPSQQLLVKGPAMPYFPPASREVRNLFELDDYDLAKGCAIMLLVYKMEKLAHKVISNFDDDIEVWGGQPHVKEGMEESVSTKKAAFGGPEVVPNTRGLIWRHSYC
jgi:hypothetical protein